MAKEEEKGKRKCLVLNRKILVKSERAKEKKGQRLVHLVSRVYFTLPRIQERERKKGKSNHSGRKGREIDRREQPGSTGKRGRD